MPSAPTFECWRTTTSSSGPRDVVSTSQIHTNPQVTTKPRSTTVLWQPKKTQQTIKPNLPTPSLSWAQGYKTPKFHESFCSILAPSRPSEGTIPQAIILPAFYRFNEALLEALIETTTSPSKQHIHLTHGLEERSWTTQSAKTHIVNETMLHLWSKIVLKQKHINPIRWWEDANWLYLWTHPTPGKSLCILVTLILCNESTCSLWNTDGMKWTLFSMRLQNQLPLLIPQQAQAWDLYTSDLSTFLGCISPKLSEDTSYPLTAHKDIDTALGESKTLQTDSHNNEWSFSTRVPYHTYVSH